ncbi:hypothetical protein JL720_7182 [Aureococcus anophagefferens]|nr:hypothetical protein JL720_7182 [Aureococcus anophagefferens]
MPTTAMPTIHGADAVYAKICSENSAVLDPRSAVGRFDDPTAWIPRGAVGLEKYAEVAGSLAAEEFGYEPVLVVTSLVFTFWRTNIIADTETIFGPVALSVRDPDDCFAVVLSVTGPDDSCTIAAGA